MTIAEFLSQFVEHLYGLWPVRIVPENEVAIRWFRGRIIGSPGPGLVLFCPVLGEVETCSAVWAPDKTARMDLATRDGKSVTCQFLVQSRIRDMAAAWRNVEDPPKAVIEQTEAAAGLAVPELRSDELGELRGRVEAEARRLCHGWGLEIKRVVPTTLVVTDPVRIIQNGGDGQVDE